MLITQSKAQTWERGLLNLYPKTNTYPKEVIIMSKTHQSAGEHLLSQVTSMIHSMYPDTNVGDLQSKLSEIVTRYDVKHIEQKEAHPDLLEKAELFLSAKQLEGLSPLTIQGYNLELRIFAGHIHKRVDEITTGDLRVYLGKFNHLKMSSISKRLSVLKSFFGWLTAEEIIPRDPTAKIKTPKTEKRPPKALSIEELEMLREGCKTSRQRALLEVLYATGCRLSEVISLNRDEVDFGEMGARVVGKGNKIRDVFLSHKASYHLKKYLFSRGDQDPALFVTERRPHKRLGARSVQREIDTIAEQAGLNKKISPHCLRHTFATLTLNNGAELAAVQALLGHSSPQTTMIYAQLTDEKKKESHRKYLVL